MIFFLHSDLKIQAENLLEKKKELIFIMKRRKKKLRLIKEPVAQN